MVLKISPIYLYLSLSLSHTQLRKSTRLATLPLPTLCNLPNRMKKTVSKGNILSWGQVWLELKHTLSNSCSGLLNIHYLARTLDNYNEIWRYNKFITVAYAFLWAFSLTWQKSKQSNKNLKEVIQDSGSPCVLLSVRFYIMSDLASSRMGHLAHIEIILGN